MGNLGPAEARKRMRFGAAMIVLGVAATIVLILLKFHGGPWLLLLFIPFWLGTIGLLQARAST